MDWGKVLSGLANIVGTFSRKVHDESQKVNADNASRAGLEVRVSRTYDDVGLSGRRDCQFCLDRECTNATLDEAYEIGAFQRHPGCGCEITYTTEKGTKVQTDWTKNQWENDQNDDIIKSRKNVGIEENERPNPKVRQIIRPDPGEYEYGNPIRRSVGAWSLDEFHVENPFTGEPLQFVPNSKPIYPHNHLLAGKGSKKPIRKIEDLLEYGGRPEDWRHEKAYLETYDDNGFEAFTEIHWFECDGLPGKIDAFPKIRDGEIFFYDIKEWENKWKW